MGAAIGMLGSMGGAAAGAGAAGAGAGASVGAGAGGLMGGAGAGGGIGSMVGGASGGAGAGGGIGSQLGGGLMNGGSMGGGGDNKAMRGNMMNIGMSAASPQDLSAGQSPQTLMGSAAVAQPEKEKADIWTDMSTEDLEKKFFSGEFDFDNMTPEQKDRVGKYLSEDDSSGQQKDYSAEEAGLRSFGMSGMGASTPQPLPQTPGMGGLMGLATRGLQQVPYKSNSGLMGGH